MGISLVDLITKGCSNCDNCTTDKTLRLLKTSITSMIKELNDIKSELDNVKTLDDTKLSKTQLKALHHSLQILLLQDTSKIDEFYPIFNKLDKMILS